jgi:hypothetical protein
MTTEVSKQNEEVAQKLDYAILNVIGQNAVNGFVRAHNRANAIALLKEALSPEFMAPIMLLQGTRLGFKTDKDTSGGYHISIVKQCVIEATLMGLEVTDNQWNIISSNLYITKEGCKYLLMKIKDLDYEIVPMVPKIEGDQATVVMKITWHINGKTETREIDFVIKKNNGMGADAIIGKATRKASAWLLGRVTGIDIPEGDISDADIPKTSNTITIAPTAENNLSAQAEKVDASTKAEVDKVSSPVQGVRKV